MKMKILLGSRSFAPALGGIETVSRLLAEQWQRSGHQVVVVTSTTSSNADDLPYRVIRRPKTAGLFTLLRWADVFFQNNVSLHTGWPALLFRRPWVVATQTWMGRAGGGSAWSRRVKLLALKRAKNVYISRAVATHVGLPGEIIPNPYDSATFRPYDDVPRDRDLVFVGRLVADKGVDVLLQAIAQLKSRGIIPSTTIIGGGPEDATLCRLARELGLDLHVTFAGMQRETELARMIARHRIMVIPSRWEEPFGVVALEGIACGCAVVGSNRGGLPEAIGPCGVTFPNGSADSLAEVLERLLDGNSGFVSALLDQAPGHLSKHAPDVVARRYLEIFDPEAGSRECNRN
jgi:glycogen synthase